MSIDVAVGAMVSAAFFARIFHVQLDANILAALGISVWIIYSADHLLDAHKLKKDASTNRHLFHQRHFGAVSLAVIVALVIDLILIQDIGRKSIFLGTILMCAIALYLLFQRWLGPFKELIGALLYFLGVLLPVLSLLTTPTSTPVIFLMLGFFLTALINLLILAWFDFEHDLKDGHISAVTFFGRQKSTTVLVLLFVFQAILFGTLLLAAPYKWVVLILVAMNVVLLVIFYLRNRIVKEDFYRLASEVVFLLPLLYLIFE